MPRELHFSSGKNPHGCNLPRGIRVEDLDYGVWICPACDAAWQIQDIYWRDPGMQAFEHQKYTGSFASRVNTEYLFTWRLVKRGRKINERKEMRRESAARLDRKVQMTFQVICSMALSTSNWAESGASYVPSVDVEITTNHNGRRERIRVTAPTVFRKSIVAAPGDRLSVTSVPVSAIPRVTQQCAIYLGKRPVNYEQRNDNGMCETSYVVPED